MRKKMRKIWKIGGVLSGLALVAMTGCSVPGMLDTESATTEKTTEITESATEMENLTTEATENVTEMESETTEATENVTETETQTTESVTEETVAETESKTGDDAVWDDFIQSGKYRDYTGKCFSTSREGVMQTPDDLGGFKYTLYDLDGDGTNELILEADASGVDNLQPDLAEGEPNNDNFHFEWTFGIDGTGNVVQADSNVGYGDMRYSEKYKALVAIPGTRPSQNMSYWAFLAYADCSVSVQFTVARQDGQEIIRKGSDKEDISGQFDEYMSTCKDFDWVFIEADEIDGSAGQTDTLDAETQTEAASEIQTEDASGDKASGNASIAGDELCSGYWTQYGQQSWLIKFVGDGTAKVYNMIGIMENSQGGSISDEDIVSDITYSFDGSILTLNGFVHGNTVTLAAYMQDETLDNVTDKQKGIGNVYFYEDGYDSSDPMGDPVVIGEADTSDSMVSTAIDWVESR